MAELKQNNHSKSVAHIGITKNVFLSVYMEYMTCCFSVDQQKWTILQTYRTTCYCFIIDKMS